MKTTHHYKTRDMTMKDLADLVNTYSLRAGTYGMGEQGQLSWVAQDLSRVKVKIRQTFTTTTIEVEEED